MDECAAFSAAQEPDDPLAAMISTVADGDASSLNLALLGLELVTAAQDKGLTWAQIGAALGYPSGREAKKAVHGLRDRVKREQAAGGLGSRP
jgi:lysophospholipid acyltransferase (LPLAT)-like uncharacterized protein